MITHGVDLQWFGTLLRLLKQATRCRCDPVFAQPRASSDQADIKTCYIGIVVKIVLCIDDAKGGIGDGGGAEERVNCRGSSWPELEMFQSPPDASMLPRGTGIGRKLQYPTRLPSHFHTTKKMKHGGQGKGGRGEKEGYWR